MAATTYQPEELIPFLLATSESSHIDAKGPTSWDDDVNSAKLSKDIAAFANSTDGGVLVIGKSEKENGSFELVGLTEEQARSFETTKVANWVNSRFSPPIHLQCHRVEYESKLFIVITVKEFQDIPILCVKTFQDRHHPKKHHLSSRTIYVRTANAESAPLGTENQMRELIGLATKKRGDELITSFRSLLQGRSLVQQQSDDEKNTEEFQFILKSVHSNSRDKIADGVWQFAIRPCQFDSNRFSDDFEDLEKRIKRNAVHLRNEFPPYTTGTHMREWGICNEQTYCDFWTLACSGQFVLWRPYPENGYDFQSPWNHSGGGGSVEPSLNAGTWLNFKPSLFSIFEFFLFASRLTQEYEFDVRFEIRITGNNLQDRRLATTDPKIGLEMSGRCVAHEFSYSVLSNAAEFLSVWEERCVEAMKKFVDLFPKSDSVSKATLNEWVRGFKDRRF